MEGGMDPPYAPKITIIFVLAKITIFDTILGPGSRLIYKVSYYTSWGLILAPLSLIR